MSKLRLSLSLFTLTLAATLAAPALATPLTEFNAGLLLTDFRFDDALGTPIESTLNSASPAAPFDTDADFASAATNGTGQFDGSGKNNTEFGSVYSDLPTISSGVVYGLFEVSWAFDEQVYDTAQDEEFRLSLIANDPRSTFVTGEIFFTRTSATTVELVGNAVGTGSTDTSVITLGSSGSLLTILKADLDADTLELFYSADGGTTFLAATVGALDPARGVESVRFVLNEDFSNDSLLVERFALSVVPEPAGVALLLAALLMPQGRRRA
ncbi:hypothetical protein [Botrimarina hoheduenensis]|uniref:PEP-CTERM protein-sorting domain-containing protein n=1 Tax=Botrimarina hoheduenensis TaxID=2528000 RepID=A0A5C5WBD8_9BACT|nr:hypothetical protein [Botrimarina hoheduenensis]TWT47389.1 hypothetical protein Pla111_10030 [Botrimarina hoheduenensis]